MNKIKSAKRTETKHFWFCGFLQILGMVPVLTQVWDPWQPFKTKIKIMSQVEN